MIGYLNKDSADGHTKAGSWVSYLDATAIEQYVSYAKKKGLHGAFAFDISMDTLNYNSGEFSWELTKSLAEAVQKIEEPAEKKGGKSVEK